VACRQRLWSCCEDNDPDADAAEEMFEQERCEEVVLKP